MIAKDTFYELLNSIDVGPFESKEVRHIKLLNRVSRRLSHVDIYLVTFTDESETKVCAKQLISKHLLHDSAHFLKSEFEIQQAIHKSVSKYINLPNAYIYNQDLGVFISEYIEHRFTAEDVFTKPANWIFKNKFKNLKSIVTQSAIQLHTFRKATNNIDYKLPSVDINIKDYLMLRFQLIFAYLNQYHSKELLTCTFKQVGDYIEQEVPSQLELDGTPVIHGDYTPANLLVTDSKKLSFIDFADAKHSVVEQDIACFQNYLLMLSLNKFWFSRSKTSSLIKVFEDAYSNSSDSGLNLGYVKIIRLRMLMTNTLSLVYECESSILKRFLYRRRLKRYVNAITKSIAYSSEKLS